MGYTRVGLGRDVSTPFPSYPWPQLLFLFCFLPLLLVFHCGMWLASSMIIILRCLEALPIKCEIDVMVVCSSVHNWINLWSRVDKKSSWQYSLPDLCFSSSRLPPMLILWRVSVMAPSQDVNFSVAFVGQTPRAAADKWGILCCSQGKRHKKLRVLAGGVGFKRLHLNTE